MFNDASERDFREVGEARQRAAFGRRPRFDRFSLAGYGTCCPLIDESGWAFDGLGNVELSPSVWAEQLG